MRRTWYEITINEYNTYERSTKRQALRLAKSIWERNPFALSVSCARCGRGIIYADGLKHAVYSSEPVCSISAYKDNWWQSWTKGALP